MNSQPKIAEPDPGQREDEIAPKREDQSPLKAVATLAAGLLGAAAAVAQILASGPKAVWWLIVTIGVIVAAVGVYLIVRRVTVVRTDAVIAFIAALLGGGV